MSAIGDIIAYLSDTIIPAELPSYDEIPEPIDAEENAEIFFDEGFYVIPGPSVAQTQNTKDKFEQDRTFLIGLVAALPNDRSDAAAFRSCRIKLLEDAQKLAVALNFDETCLGGDAILVRVLGDEGVEPFGEDDRYYRVELDVEVKYNRL